MADRQARADGRPHGRITGALLAALVAAPWLAPTAAAQATSEVSVNADGEPATQSSGRPAISADGRWVAFSSPAANLVPDDDNGAEDVFVRDLETGAIVRVSRKTDGTEANGHSINPVISADGRFVAFESIASNLIGFDPGAQWDVFVHDRDLDGNGTFDEPTEDDTVQTFRASSSFSGQPDADSGDAALSSDGLSVVYVSKASNMVPGLVGKLSRVFVFERDTDGNGLIDTPSARRLLSVGHEGQLGGFPHTAPAVSGDGRFVAWQSASPDMVADDANGTFVDVFLRDRDPDANGVLDEGNGTTTLVSAGPGGSSERGGARPDLSGDGRWIAYESLSTDLAADEPPPAGTWQVWVHDRVNGTNRLISRDGDDAPGSADSRDPSISEDGRFVVFDGFAGELAPGGAGWREVFVHDRDSGDDGLFDGDDWTIARASVSTEGAAADGPSREADVSGDGGDIVFLSLATNLTGDGEDDDKEIVVLNGREPPGPEPQPLPTGWFPLDPEETGVAGFSGIPDLAGEGTLVVSDAQCVELRDARPFETAFLFAGATRVDVPLLGGVLVPSPEIQCCFTVPTNKTITIDFAWPEEFGGGAELYLQFWVTDPFAPQGFSVSNALFARSP